MEKTITLTENKIKESASKARNWLLNSGIQNQENNNLKGSFNCWFDTETKTYPFVYSEITGYALTALTYLDDEETKNRAVITANWLKSIAQLDNKGFLCLYSSTKNEFYEKENQIYTFDTGIIINGLLNLYRITKENSILESAKKAADWLVEIQNPNGSIHPRFNRDYNKIDNDSNSWSTISGSFHCKISMGMLNLFDITKDERYKIFVERICNYSLEKQTKEGRFNTYENQVGTNLHPHCYSAEGLLAAGIYLKNERYIEAAAKATEWILKNQKEESITPRIFINNGFNYNERTDVISQTLRLTIIMKELGYLKEDYDINIKRTFNRLISLQSQKNKDNQEGGFFFGNLSSGKEAKHINSWCTMFAMQAIKLYDTKNINEIYRLLI